MSADLKLPQKGFTKQERAWLEQLIQAIKSVRAIQGANCTVSDNESGQTISANPCPPCP